MFAVRTLILASLAIVAQVSSAAKCTRSYTVKEGDYCDKISAANNVSTYQLGANNPGVINEACDNLVIGGTLCLGTKGEDCSTTYVVSAGDTCSQIWENTRVNATIFSFNNPQVDDECSNIYIGEVLCVAGEVLVPPAPDVPIHTAPAPVPQASPTAAPAGKPVKTNAPASTTPAPPVAAKPTATPPPAVAAPPPAKPPAGDADDEEDCDEYEVVDPDTDEDLPFCDELEDD